MRLRELAERRIFGDASGETLQPLSPQEIQRVAGAAYYGPMPVPHGPLPPHGPFPGPFPFPIPELY